MGSRVLESGVPVQAGLHVYAHCQRAAAGGVTLLVINNDRDAPHQLTIARPAQRYTLDAASPGDGTVRLNGATLALVDADDLPRLAGVATPAGLVTFAPATITFLAVPTRKMPCVRCNSLNASCPRRPEPYAVSFRFGIGADTLRNE